jgi:hypothetical protein
MHCKGWQAPKHAKASPAPQVAYPLHENHALRAQGLTLALTLVHWGVNPAMAHLGASVASLHMSAGHKHVRA